MIGMSDMMLTVVVPLAVLSVAELVAIVCLLRRLRQLRELCGEQSAVEEAAGHGEPAVAAGGRPAPPAETQPEPVALPLPDAPATPLSLTDSDRQFLDRLQKFILEGMAHGKVEIESLADQMCLSRSQLNRRVKTLTGQSTSNYSIQLRLSHACELLTTEPELTVADVALRCGFDDAAYFTRLFRRRIGVAPTTFRKNSYE